MAGSSVGPVTPDGTGTVTLTTTVGNMGLIAGTTYGFALYTTSTPTNATETITVGPTTGTVTLPTFNGAGGTITIGSFAVSDGSGATTSKVTFETWTSLPPFAIAPPQTGAYFPPLFVTVTSSHQVTVSNLAGTFSAPTGWTAPAGSNVHAYLEAYAPRSTGSWFVDVAGPSSATPSAFTYTPSITLVGGRPYTLAVYPSTNGQ
jgi:hypothetical protein